MAANPEGKVIYGQGCQVLAGIPVWEAASSVEEGNCTVSSSRVVISWVLSRQCMARVWDTSRLLEIVCLSEQRT